MGNRLIRFCAAASPRAMRRTAPFLHRGEAGQQMVLVSLMLPLLLVFVGLVVDVGNVFVHRRMAQNAADAAAMAGSARLSIGQASAQNTALAYAASNNYGDDAVTVTFPAPECIRVQVDEDVRPLLASLIWNGTFGISARASACKMQVDLGASVIVLAGGNRAGALTVGGNSSLIVEHGNVHVNSSSLQAVTMNGSKSKIRTETPATIVGDTDSFSAFAPEPFIGAAVLQDPLQNLPEPSKPAQCVSKQVKTTADLKSRYFCYTGGFSLSSSNAVKLPAGQYWIEGGISVNGPNAKITGDGVTLYVVGGSVDIKKCSECKLTPPESGIYEDIIFFGSRSKPPTFGFTAGANLSLEGIVYNPNGAMELAGGADMEANFAVGTLNMTGNTDLIVEGFTSDNWSTTEYRMTE